MYKGALHFSLSSLFQLRILFLLCPALFSPEWAETLKLLLSHYDLIVAHPSSGQSNHLPSFPYFAPEYMFPLLLAALFSISLPCILLISLSFRCSQIFCRICLPIFALAFLLFPYFYVHLLLHRRCLLLLLYFIFLSPLLSYLSLPPSLSALLSPTSQTHSEFQLPHFLQELFSYFHYLAALLISSKSAPHSHILPARI